MQRIRVGKVCIRAITLAAKLGIPSCSAETLTEMGTKGSPSASQDLSSAMA
ncbi:MAG: hypothetical protein RL571_144 [Pseudomonadota bacterium]|jgi:hypothetical protein